MSSSRSNDVTKFVCVCVSLVILLCLEYSNNLKLNVSRVSPGCIKDVSRVVQMCLKGVFQGSFKICEGVSRELQKCFMGASRMFHGC